MDNSHKINEKISQSLNILKEIYEPSPAKTYISNALFPQAESTLDLNLDQSTISKGNYITSNYLGPSFEMKSNLSNVTTFHQLYQKVGEYDKQFKKVTDSIIPIYS